MLADLIKSLQSFDPLTLAIGGAFGAAAVFIVLAWQVSAQRRAFGYDLYRADVATRRLRGWAGVGIVAGAVILAAYVFQHVQSAPPQVSTASSTPVVTDYLANMKLVIPRMGLEIPVISASIVGRDWDISRMTTEVSHLEGTAVPGQPGNAVLVGHITIPNAGWGPFHELDQLKPGDVITIRITGYSDIRYVVSETMIVGPQDVQVALPTDDTRLTLITCDDFDRTLNYYTRRLVVVALLSPFPALAK